MRRKRSVRLAVVVLFCAVACVTTGCSYTRHRVEDALQVVDVGLTITTTPQIGLYWNSLDVFPVGYSHLDGWFVGWGGNQIGVTRHYNKCWGFGYGRQIVGWGEFDKDDPQTLHVDSAGILGTLLPPYKNDPAYTPACVHFVPHIGFLGLVWNARYYEMVDFVFGFTTIDLAGDDGARIGHWPWQTQAKWE